MRKIIEKVKSNIEILGDRSMCIHDQTLDNELSRGKARRPEQSSKCVCEIEIHRVI